MDGSFIRRNNETVPKKYRRGHLLGRLKAARNKLTPIIDDIIVSAVDLLQKGEKKFVSERTLTQQQYQDVVWATQILRETENQFRVDDKKYYLPNSSVIINNVSVDGKKKGSVSDNNIVIDERSIIELLEVYEQMGVIIHRIIDENTPVRDENTPVRDETSETFPATSPDSQPDIVFKSRDASLGSHSSRKQTTRSRSTSRHDTTFPASTTSTEYRESEEMSSNNKSEEKFSRKSWDNKSEEFHRQSSENKSKEKFHRKTEKGCPCLKSTLSVLLDRSFGDVRKDSSQLSQSQRIKSDHVKINDDVKVKSSAEPTIFIRIQCFTDGSETDYTQEKTDIKCSNKDCNVSHYHVKLDGEPLTLKMNQNNIDDNPIYCINAGSEDDNDVKIIIRQCPECKSTIIGSSSKIKESHESITLHGKTGDESKMEYSSEDSTSVCQCPNTITIDLYRDHVISQPKMDVLIDTDSVDKSTVKVRSVSSKEDTGSRRSREPSIESRAKIQPPDIPPLMRRRICSSMEFDVSTVPTRLRDQKIEHNNAKIVVELNKLSVDKILRACRPAKCCRKAILNERQRTALPYCVSLRSLPLMGNDVEVIKQSIDMSVKKNKNAIDLTQAYRDKLAFYVSLGKDDIKPHNSPWVVPLYDVKLNVGEEDEDSNKNKFYVIEKPGTVPKQVGSVVKLLEMVDKLHGRNQAGPSRINCSQDRFFILKRLGKRPSASSESSLSLIKQKCVKKHKLVNRNLQIVFNNVSQRQSYVMNHSRKQSCCTRKQMWSSRDRFIFTRRQRQFDFSTVDVKFKKMKPSKLSHLKSSESHLSQICPEMAHLNGFPCCNNSDSNKCNISGVKQPKKTLEGGDCGLSSLLNFYENRINTKNLYKEIFSSKMHKENSLTSARSLPAFWNHVSEELFYTSSRVTLFVKRRHSLGHILSDKSKFAKIQEDRLERLKTFKLVDDRSSNSKKKTVLEYYIGLIGGNLVWSNTLPLIPQNYETYYNYSNEQENNKNVPVEDPMVATHVTREEARRVPTAAPKRTPPPLESNSERRRSTLSEIHVEQPYLVENLQNEPPKEPSITEEPPSRFAPFSMGPESQDEPWAPLLVSETSLPRLHEEVIKKKEVEIVEAVPVKRVKSTCSSKAICRKNECPKSKPCSSKKCNARDITIAIKKTKDKGIFLEGKAPQPCNKEICEIYKNKKLMEKSGGSGKEQKFTCSAKDNIEIIINGKKICVANNKKVKTSDKDSKNEKKPKEKE